MVVSFPNGQKHGNRQSSMMKVIRHYRAGLRFSLLMLCALIALSPSFAAPYKWVDSKGQVHYSQIPPENHQSQTVDVSLYQSNQPAAESPAAKSNDERDGTERELEAEQKRINEQMAKNREQNCLNAKHDLMVLENNHHVRIKEADDFRVLSQEEREERITRLKTQTSELCQ